MFALLSMIFALQKMHFTLISLRPASNVDALVLRVLFER
jgi:hypothetical protein